MLRPRTGPARLLAVLLLLQWAGAVLPHARAMTQLASAQAVELCTHEGRQQVLLDEDGKPLKLVQADDCCTLCQVPVATTPSEPPKLAQPVGYELVADLFGTEGLPTTPPRAPPQQPRAPPLS